ncbi:amidohydrolase family protein [Puia dinghuensis]|uniref:Xaa-Pro dipeptidase n=1 Tax=Puia dinghuensis TaxID=1792502 RepID=A0A8J2XTF3_9BACT|nr:amidohydrolase family protein [Puia dinghuensis]GGB02939.1 Xaa-Pro dipeptidase [Puia dinghuensis]
MKAIILALTGLFAATSLVTAQQVTVLTNATIIDGTGREPQSHMTMLIQNGRIAKLTRDKIAVPPGTAQIDMTGKYLMPQLINCHGHLGNVRDTTASSANYTRENVIRQLQLYQDYGVGAVLSMGTEQPLGLSIREDSRAGLIPGATMYSALFGFGVKGAMPPESAGFTSIYRPETPAEAANDVDELAAWHPDVIKIWVDNFYGQFQTTMKEEIYTAIIQEAHKHGIRVAAHVYHLADARKLLSAGLDMMAHSIRDGEIDDSLIAEMKAKHVAYIPTLSLDEFATAYLDDPSWLNDPFFRNSLEPGVYTMITSQAYKDKIGKSPVTPQEKEALKYALINLRKLHKAGILIALGTDSGATPIRAQGFSEHLELELMVKAGLTPLEAIKVGTYNGAHLLRIADDRGTLEPGKRASFLVLDKDPITNIRNTRTLSAVWTDGVKVSDGPLAIGKATASR